MATPAIYDFPTRLGLIFIVLSASISAVAVTGLLLYIVYNAVVLRRWSMETHAHYYFLNLLVSDLVEALGAILTVKWAAEAQVVRGPVCTAQGMIKQIGAVAVSLTTLAIAVHTLLVLVFHLHTRPETALVVITLIWLFIILVVGICFATQKGFYGVTPYWCWITEDFRLQRILLEYMWLWVTNFCNTIIYVFLALVIKGVVTVEQNKIRFRKAEGQVTAQFARIDSDQKNSNDVARQMLFYPAVYIVTTVPYSTIRWMLFNHETVPFPAVAVAGVLFSSSGVLNVILYTLTRPRLLPNRGHSNSVSTSDRRNLMGHGHVRMKSQNTFSFGDLRKPPEIVNISPTQQPLAPTPNPFLHPLKD